MLLAVVLGCAGGKGVEAAPQSRRPPVAAASGRSGAPWPAPASFDEDVRLFPVGDRIGVTWRYEGDSRPSLALWDPRDGLWTELDDLPEIREGGGIAWLPDGTLVVAGGYNGDDFASTTLVRRPTGEWLAVPTGELGYAEAAALPDGRVLVLGEEQALLFDPETLRRAAVPGAPPAGDPSVGVGPDGLVLVGGSDDQDRALTQAVRFDAAGPHPLPDLPSPRVAAVVAPGEDGRIAVVGGYASYSDAEAPTSEALLFDGAAWTALDLGVAHREPAVAWLRDGSLLVVGEEGAVRVEPGRSEEGRVTPIPHTGASAAALGLPDGRALVVGGWYAPHDAAIFDPELGRFRRGSPGHPEWVGRLEGGSVVALGSRGDSLGSLFARLDPDGGWTELAPVPPDAWAAGLGAGTAWSSEGERLLRYQAAEDTWSPVPAPPGDPLVGAGGVWTRQEGRFGRVSDGRTFTPPARWGADPVVLADGALLVGPGVAEGDEHVPAVLIDGEGPRAVPGLPEGEGGLLALPDGGALWFGSEATFALDAARRSFVEVESPPAPVFGPDREWIAPAVLADPPPDGKGALVVGVGRYEAGRWSAVAPRPAVIPRAVAGDDGTVLLIGGGVWSWDPRADPTPARTQAPPSPELLARVRPALGSGSPAASTCGARPAPPPLTTPRGRVAAVRVGSQVLAIGGSADVRASEVVDAWDGAEPVRPPALPKGLDEAAGVVLSDGRVLVVGVGGATDGEAFLLSGDRWTPAPLPVGADRPSVVALPGGGALAIGGASWHKPSMQSAWRLDGSRWTAVPLGDPMVANPTAVGLGDGRVLVVGGRIPDWWGSGPDQYAAAARIYAAGKFTATAPLAQARVFATATRMADGRVLVVGGIAADPDPPADADGMIRVMDLGSRARGLRSAEIWDPETGTWSDAADLAIGRWHHAAGLLPDGSVLVVGGVEGDDSGTPLDAERYDPATDRWTPVPLRAPRKDAAVVEVEGGLWVVGGLNGTYEVGEIEAFGSGGCSVAAAPVTREEGRLVPLDDGSVLLLGGRSDHHPVRTIERYTGGTWVVAGSLPDDLADGVPARLGDGTVLIVGRQGSGRWDPRAGEVRPVDLAVSGAVVVPLASGVLVLGSRADQPVAITYDLASDRWAPAPPPPARPELATLLADGRVLAGAGSVGWVWDPSGRGGAGGGWAPQELGLAWSADDTLDLLPDGRVLHVSAHGLEVLERDGSWRSLGTRYARFKHRTVVAEDGRVALVGGLAAIGWESGDYVAEDVDPNAPLVVWDPRSDALEKRETELWSWFDGALVRLGDGRLLLVGGQEDPGYGAETLGARILPDPF